MSVQRDGAGLLPLQGFVVPFEVSSSQKAAMHGFWTSLVYAYYTVTERLAGNP
jgi:hypothetical protein